MQAINIEVVANGFKINVYHDQDPETGFGKRDEFVFESPAKLRKAVKLFLDQLTQKGE